MARKRGRAGGSGPPGGGSARTGGADSGGLVYSTRHGKMCPDCDRPEAECSCRDSRSIPTGDGIVRVSRETKGRKGKGVTVITGVPLPLGELEDLAKKLKQRCGTGGTIKAGAIEIQGDHRDTLIEELRKHGWTVKRAGG